MFLKDADATLDYRVDWSAATVGGLTIVASSWAAGPAGAGGLVIVDSGLDGAVAWVRLGGGTPGDVCLVRNRAAFSDGSADERSLTIRVGER
jgi:hypothetical protein